MTFSRLFKAALAGLVLAYGPIAGSAMAESLQVVRKATGRDLSITMNQAVVVESDVPFAELSIAVKVRLIIARNDRINHYVPKEHGCKHNQR